MLTTVTGLAVWQKDNLKALYVLLTNDSQSISQTMEDKQQTQHEKLEHEVKVENNTPRREAQDEGGKANEGGKVTVNVDNLANGHRVTQVIITTNDGEQISVERKDALTYEFEMPAKEVTVEVVYGPSAPRPEDSGVSEKLNADDHIAFMVGDDKGHFRPNSNITRAEFATIAANFAAMSRDQFSFDDVDESHWGWYEIKEASNAHDHSFDSEFIEETWTN